MAVRWYAHVGKRFVDLVVVILLLPIVLAVGAIVAGIVVVMIGRPILFSQRRPGLHGQPFVIYKFRTMTPGSGEACRPEYDARRLTRAGRTLRSLSLDELPQLWNVLRGDMSLVGPRPLLMEYLDRYDANQARRHGVRPGITGWAQVNGRNDLTWERKFEMDVWYVDHVSPWLDMRIIGRTLCRLPHRAGINQPGQATVLEFRGTPPSSPQPSSRPD